MSVKYVCVNFAIFLDLKWYLSLIWIFGILKVIFPIFVSHLLIYAN